MMKMIRWALVAAAAAFAFPAAAQQQYVGGAAKVAGAYPGMVPGSTIQRPNDTTQYTSTATICAAKTVTACVPGTIPIAGVNGGKTTAGRVTLFKSGATTTNANFTIWFYSAAPSLATPTQFDNVAYSGPRLADAPNYLGNASCATPIPTSDTAPGVWFECTMSNPNTGGALYLQSAANTQTIYFLISDSGTTGYTPVANEQFTPYMGGFY